MNPLQKLNRLFVPEKHREVIQSGFMEFLIAREDSLVKAVGRLTSIVAGKEAIENTDSQSVPSQLAEKAFSPTLSAVVERVPVGIEEVPSSASGAKETLALVRPEDIRVPSIEVARARIDSVFLNSDN